MTIQTNSSRRVYEGDAPWDIGGPQPALVELISEFPLIEPVLDVGSGSGDHAIWIAQQGLHVVGVDFIPSAVELSRKRASSLPDDLAANVEFQVGDALRPSELGREFRSIVDSGFYHLFEADKCEQFANDLRTALRPGGRYYILAFAIDFPVPDVPRGITRVGASPQLRQRRLEDAGAQASRILESSRVRTRDLRML